MASDTRIPTRIALLEKEVGNVSNIFSRIETATERLADISSSLKEMLAVHDSKINKVEESAIHLYELIEKRRNEAEVAYNKVQLIVNETEKKLKEDMDNFQKNLLSEMKDLRKELKEYYDGNQKILSTLEKGKLILYGIGIIISFILYKLGIIPFIAKF